MSEFHPFTLAAAVDLMEVEYPTHDRLDTLIFSWGCAELSEGSSIKRKLLTLATVAAKTEIEARTIEGNVALSRAIISAAIAVPEMKRKGPAWNQLVAGLRFDGFELIEVEIESDGATPIFGRKKTIMKLVRMLPDDVPELDFREAESEVDRLLSSLGFKDAIGHLKQATSAFQRGDWAAANAQLRTFYQDILDSIAEILGCDPDKPDDAKRQFLAEEASGPFLIHEYNEWQNDRGRPSFIQGLWARLHPHGSHPGLSEEDDAAFRLQTTLITARLLLRRLNERKSVA